MSPLLTVWRSSQWTILLSRREWWKNPSSVYWLILVLLLAGAMLSFCWSVGSGINLPLQINAVCRVTGRQCSVLGKFESSTIKRHAPVPARWSWAAAGNFHLNMGWPLTTRQNLMLVIDTVAFLKVMVYTDGYKVERSRICFHALPAWRGFNARPRWSVPDLYFLGTGRYAFIYCCRIWHDARQLPCAARKHLVNRVCDFGIVIGHPGVVPRQQVALNFRPDGDRLQDLA